MSLKVISKTELELSFSAGYERVLYLDIVATAEGLELGTKGVIPWEWIDKARAEVSK